MMIINREKKYYRMKFLEEVKNLLETKYGFSNQDALVMVKTLKGEMNSDPDYVFHFDSRYWAEYIAGISGLGKREVM